MTVLLFADEYSGDQGRTDYRTLAKATPLNAIKCGEGLGTYPSYAPMHAAAKAAGLLTIAYFWPLMREDGKAQAEQHVRNAGDAEGLAVDLEAGRAGTHSSNTDASKTTVLRVMHAYFDRLHELRPQPLLLYGASYMGDAHITWAELVGGRDWLFAWLPRYSGGGDIKTWSRQRIIDYALPARYAVPPSRIAAVQFTDGAFGPQPHTLPGLNRAEDISVLLMPIETITGGDMLTDDQQHALQRAIREDRGKDAFHSGKKAPRKGTPERFGYDLAKLVSQEPTKGRTK